MANKLKLPSLDQQINQEHLKYEVAFKEGLQHAINTGLLLIRAKSKCEKGNWSRWLSDNVTFSEHTARGYMKVAGELPALEGGIAQHVENLSLREALALMADLAVPEQTPAELEAAGYERNVDLLAELTLKPLRQVQELVSKFQKVEILLGDKFDDWLYLQHHRTHHDYEELKAVAQFNSANDDQVLQVLWKWYGEQPA